MSDYSLVQEGKPTPIKINKGRPKAFKCPNCGGTITVKAIGHSINAVCAYCSSVVDLANDNLKLITTAHQKTRSTLLNIGSRGRLMGIMWEVIGYMEKTDHSDIYHWDEYLLYNPYHGFRFLVQNQGHWSLFKVLKQSLGNQALNNELRLNGKKYELFLKGWAKVVYVKGEFYWRVQKDERTKVYDYIAPPQLLSVAINNDEINLALGEYLDAKTIGNAFDIEGSMPSRSGVAANQPGAFVAKDIWEYWLTAVAAIMLATLVQLISLGGMKEATVYSNTFTLTDSDIGKPLATDSFTLTKQSTLAVNCYSPLNNDWLELDLSLVNSQDEEIRTAKQAIEYYYGTDYDSYYWTEGSNTNEILFSAIPKGQYRLLIDVDSGSLHQGKTVNLTLRIRSGVKSWSNYGFTLLLILIYPIYVTVRYKLFETRRWAESDIPLFT